MVEKWAFENQSEENSVRIIKWTTLLGIFCITPTVTSCYHVHADAHLSAALLCYCCNLSGGVALIVWFTTNGICVKNNTIMYVARTSNNRVIPMEWCWWVTSNNACEPGEQLIVLANGVDESSRRVISIVACCSGAKLCAHAARDFRSQHYLGATGAETSLLLTAYCIE